MQKIEIPHPSLEVQKEIVAEVEGYQKTIEEYKHKIEEEEGNIKRTINRLWGEEE